MMIRTVFPQAADRDSRSASRPFSILDELNCYFDSAAEPNNVHLEVWLPGRLSPERLSAAAAAVIADVPAARARRAVGTWWHTGYSWEVPPQADIQPVSVTGWRDSTELDLARARFLATAPDLHRSPPFRLLLAQGPDWASLILKAHHAAFDGRSCLRLLRLIADRYSGREPGEAPVPDRVRAAPLGRGGRAARRGARSRARAAARPLPVRRAARIAPQHTEARVTGDAPGYGLRLLEWRGVPAPPQPPSGSHVTVNDLLIAALIQTITRWNTARRRRPAQVRITMPMDTRPRGHGDDLGNLSRLCTVTLDPRRVADPAAAVADQTRQAKSASSPPASPVTAVARMHLPVPLKRSLVRLGLRGLGGVGCDSSLLSNLGNITDPPKFGPVTPTRMWFSTSAHMPRGLSVGAITLGGRLQLCFRYRNALLDAPAGRDFAAEYAEALSALSALPARPGAAGEEASR
jgi:NRPS condensation-like uncharacterized protein